MPHVYKVGQTLDLSSAPSHLNRPKGSCKILACLPHEKGPALYRVQCFNERNERVVEETDLSPNSALHALQASQATEAADKAFVSVAISRR